MSDRWQGRPSARLDFVDDLFGSVTPGQERVCSFRCWKLSHVAFFVNRLVLPEGNKATTRGAFYPVSRVCCGLCLLLLGNATPLQLPLSNCLIIAGDLE